MMGVDVWTMLTEGEPIIFLLAAMSVVSLALIVVKVVQLWPATGGVAARKAALDLWATGDRHGAMGALPSRAPADRVLKAGMEALQAGMALSLVEGDLARRGNDEVAALSGGLRLLDLISMVSPLIGLLGTVLGIINAFLGLATKGSGNIGAVAPGIATALVATAAALTVAIPAAFGYNIFANRLNRVERDLEGYGSELIALLAREGRL